MPLMPFGSAPDKWKVETAGSEYLRPKVETQGLMVGQDPHASIASSFSGTTALFNGEITGASNGLSYFINLAYGSSFIPLGGTFLAARTRGTAASPTQTLAGDWLGGLTFTGYDGSSFITTNSTHLLAGYWSMAATDVTAGNLNEDIWMGGILTKMIGFESDTNAINFNEALLDSDITFYNDTGVTATMDGANGGLAVSSLGTRAALSGDSTGGTGTGLVVKSSTNNYTFEYQKSDGSNLLRAVWDTGNFHHYLGGTLYYNIATYNFVIDGNGNSNIGLILTGGAELKLDASITGAVPNIRLGGGSYATSGTPLTTTNVFWNSTWAWNGSNGYTLTTQSTLNQVQQSTTAGDANLVLKNNAAATVMTIGLLNKTMTVTGHSALGAATVDAIPAMTALSGTLSTNLNNYNTFTDGSLTQNATVLNCMTVDATANNASNWIAQDGLVEVKSGNNKNYTGLIAGDGGAAYHYGTGTIAEFDGVFGIVQNNSSGTITTAQAVRALSLHYGSGTVTNNYGLSAQLIHVSGTNTVTNYHGLHVYNPLILAGTLTTNYGIYVEAQTGAGTTNIGAMIGNSTTNTLWVGGTSDTTTVAGGIVFGSSKDTNLYRSAANNIKTDDSLTIGADLDHDGSNVGFYNVAPVARATTGGAASTFTANTSGIANDTATWDGYTIGQVVKALRNVGILT